MSDFVLRAVLGIKDDASGPASRIGGYFTNLKSRITETEGSLKSFNKSMDNLKSGAKFLAVGGAASMALKSVVAPARDFNKEMGILQAVSSASTEDMKKFNAAAYEAGLATQFNPAEATSGLAELSSAGMSAERSIKAFIPTLDLATASAGKLDVSSSAEVMGAVMNAWKVSADKSTHVADVFVKMGDLSSFKIEELSGAFRGVTMMAPQANQALESTAAVMMSIRAVGGTPVAAGEKLRMALDNLMVPSKKAKEAISALGVSTRDATTGKMRGIIDIFADMEKKMKSMSPVQRDFYVSTILGADGLAAYNAVMNTSVDVTENGVNKQLKGIEAVRSWEKQLKSADGTARRWAAIQENTLAGSEKMRSGSWETIKTILGEALVPALTKFNQLITAVLNPLAKFLKEHEKIKTVIAWIIPAVAGFTLLVGIIKTASAALGLYRILVKVTGDETKKSLIPSIYAWIRAKLSLIPLLWTHIKALGATTAAYIRLAAQGIATGIAALWNYAKAGAFVAFNTMRALATSAISTGAVFLSSLIPAIKGAVLATWSFTSALLANPITWIAIGITALVAGIVLLVKNWDKVKAAIVGAWDYIKQAWGNAPGWFKGIVALILLPFWPFIQIGKLIIKNWSSIKTFFISLYTTISSVFTKIWEFVKDTLDKIWVKIKAVWEPVKSILSSIGDFAFGDVNKQAEKSGAAFSRTFAKGIRANIDSVSSAVESVMKAAGLYVPNSDAKKGPLSHLTYSGKMFVSTFSSGVDQEAKSNPVASKFVNLQTKQISEKSPIIQKIAGGNKNEAKNLLGNLNVTVDGKNMSVEKLSSMLAQVLNQELNRIGAV